MLSPRADPTAASRVHSSNARGSGARAAGRSSAGTRDARSLSVIFELRSGSSQYYVTTQRKGELVSPPKNRLNPFHVAHTGLTLRIRLDSLSLTFSCSLCHTTETRLREQRHRAAPVTADATRRHQIQHPRKDPEHGTRREQYALRQRQRHRRRDVLDQLKAPSSIERDG